MANGVTAVRVRTESGLEALIDSARRLITLDPGRFDQVLSLCLAYLSVYEAPEEGAAEVIARCRMIGTRTAKTSA